MIVCGDNGTKPQELRVQKKHDPDGDHDMQQKADDINDPEIPMLGFMAEVFHGQQGADGTAAKAETQKSRLGDAPFAFFGFPLIGGVEDKGDKTHDGEKGGVEEDNHGGGSFLLEVGF